MNYIKTIFIIILLITFFILEYFFPYYIKRPFKTSFIHSLKNIFIGAANSLLSKAVLMVLILFNIEIFDNYHFGLLDIVINNNPVKIIISFIAIDIWMYLWHLVNHKIKFLWIFHRAHHADMHLDASSAVRFHPVEIIFSLVFKILILTLLGISKDIILFHEVILNAVTIFHHSNINLSKQIDRVLRILIVTPEMHRVHHSQIASETDSNYSSVLSVWDRIFFTYIRRADTEKIQLGLQEFTDLKWQGISGVLKIPFVKRKIII